MKRKFLPLLLTICLVIATLPSAALAFNDISDPNVALSVAVLEGMGIVTGTSTTTYSPNTNLTRAQFCTLAVRAMGIEDQISTHERKMLFSDVKPGAWYTGYVNLAYARGIINGYGNGKFGPDDAVTYGQVATILLRMLGYTSEQVGNVWPTDYTAYANELDISEGLTLDAYGDVTRGQAAILLHNAVKTEMSGSTTPYYAAISGVTSAQKVIVLDARATSGGSSDLLQVCTIGAVGVAVEYFSQKNLVSPDLEGYMGTLLINSAGKALGFVPDSTTFEDVIVSSAKTSGVTGKSEQFYRVGGGAVVICNGSLYPYSTSGYLQVDLSKGKNIRLYYNDDGGVTYLYIPGGSSTADTSTVIAETATAASELARKLGISSTGFSVMRNGAAALADNLAKYDVAYYDSATRTMRASDYRITGYIEYAYPSIEAAQTISVAGCSLEVLESAWESLSGLSLNSHVTLLLTDDCKVAAAFAPSEIRADMYGVLAENGASVTLAGSGLTLTSGEITASNNLRGSLVKVSTSKDSISCSTPSSVSASVDIGANKVGAYDIAPDCSIYEWAGSGLVYSLSGKKGVSSDNFDDIIWTKKLNASDVSYYRLNNAGQADILLLKDVTGNSYEYGEMDFYEGAQGINLGTATTPVFNSAASVTNSTSAAMSTKYLCFIAVDEGYAGIAIGGSSATSYQIVTAASRLKKVSDVGTGAFFQDGDDWYVTISGYEMPVSENVQVYVKEIDRWFGGVDGLLTAFALGSSLTVHYDRTPTTGSRVRIIEL